MKKVIVLLVAAALLSTPAFAVIRNSKHDLSSTGGQTVKSNNVGETCVFCHTPHGAATGLLAPLWNRSGVAAATWTAEQLYNSATLDQTNSNPTTVRNAVNNSDAPLCMSCHDGGSLAGGLLNPPASNGNLPPTFDAGVGTVSASSNLGATDLRNDHPIGMNYVAVLGAVAGEFRAGTANGVGPLDILPLYSSSTAPAFTSVMWCSTCHDVHNQGPVGATPFLNMSNAASALCTTCHIK